MANVKISDLPAIATLTTAAIIPATQSGVTGRTTVGAFNSGSFLTSVAGTNTITGTATPTPTYTVGQRFTFVPAVTNTGATTLNISSLGAGAVQLAGAALTGGELVASVPVTVYVTAVTPVFEIIAPTQFPDSRALVVGATDSTKKIRFEADSITTGTTRAATMPDYDVNLGQPGMIIITLTRDLTAANGAVAYTGVGFTPRFVVFISGNAGSSDARGSIGVDNGTNAYCLFGNAGGTGGSFSIDSNDSIVGNTSEGVTSQVGHITTLGTDGFTITWTLAGSPGAGTFTVVALCFR